MKAEEVRQCLEKLGVEELREVAARLYKMLPKKMAEEKGADQLLADPQGFIQAGKILKYYLGSG